MCIFYDALGVEKNIKKPVFFGAYGCQNDAVGRMLGGKPYFT